MKEIIKEQLTEWLKSNASDSVDELCASVMSGQEAKVGNKRLCPLKNYDDDIVAIIEVSEDASDDDKRDYFVARWDGVIHLQDNLADDFPVRSKHSQYEYNYVSCKRGKGKVVCGEIVGDVLFRDLVYISRR